MLVGINSIISWFSTILGFVLSLTLPDGNGGTISIRTIILFLLLTGLAFNVIKIFLHKGHSTRSNGKD